MNEVVKPQAFAAMTTDLQVSMDDVVSAFVSQYENNLFARKKELTADIRQLEKDLENLADEVREKVNGAEYADYDLPFGLTIEVNDGTINYDTKKISFKVVIRDPLQARRSYYNTSIDIEKEKPIPAAMVKREKKIQDALKDLRAELSEVLVNLKSVTRKERQVRGKIAMRKLETSGYESLMADPELLQLVQLED